MPTGSDAPRLIKSREMGFLLGELDLWREEGLISAEQAGLIRDLYAVRRRPLSRVLLGAGGALVGLGALSFVAANWPDMPRLLRVLLILGGYVACLLAAWRCEGRDYPLASRAFLLLGGFVYGAGVFLMARMFHHGGEWTSAVGWWILGLLPAALLFRDEWQLYLLQLLSLLYLTGTGAVDPFAAFFGRPQAAGLLSILRALLTPVEALDILSALWFVWGWTRGRLAFNANALLTLLFLASRLNLCLGSSLTLLVLAGLGLLLSLLPDWDEAFGDDLATLGLLMLGTCGLLLTWARCWRNSPLLDTGWASALVGLGFASARSGLAVTAAVLLTPLLLWQLHRGRVMAGIFLILLAARYFFDHLFGFLPKAWAFTVIGALCLALGFLLERRLRRRRPRGGDER